MTDAPEILEIDVVDDKIIVTLPNTHYVVRYGKPVHPSVLVHEPFDWEQDSRTSMTPSEFLDRAYDIAFMRAHDMGWVT
jgi:hypothetical protein